MALDPVCKMEVNENTAKLSFTLDGKTYLFCSEGCRTEFIRHPQDYLTPDEGACCTGAPGNEENRNV